MNNKQLYRTYVELNTSKDVEELISICSKVPAEVTISGKDENGNDWSLSAKSFLCVLIMNARLQDKRKQMAKNADWNTICVECERDIYSLISKFVI